MVKEEKGFEAKIKGIFSGSGCFCQRGIIGRKESALREVICKNYGKVFKTNRDTNFCLECEIKI